LLLLFVVVVSVCVNVSDDPTTFKLTQVRRLSGNSCPDYAAMLRDGSLLAVACEHPFKFEFDSIHPVTVADKATKMTSGISSHSVY